MNIAIILPSVVYLLILILVVIIAVTIFFEKTLKIDIKVHHEHSISQVYEQKINKGVLEEIKETADEEMLKAALHEVTTAVQLFQGLEVEDNNDSRATR